jgi:uncharacterized protein
MKKSEPDARITAAQHEIQALSSALGRSCGACSLCCKLLQIDKPELEKPANEWCRHCRPGHGGCSIYNERPPVCRDFACLWLINSTVGDEWYPARSKIIIVEATSELRYFVDPRVPGRWRKEPYHSAIRANARRGLSTGEFFTYVYVGSRRWVILPDEDVEITVPEDEFAAMDAMMDAAMDAMCESEEPPPDSGDAEEPF